MKNRRLILILTGIFILSAVLCPARDLSFNGQLSVWGTAGEIRLDDILTGIRYIPQWQTGTQLSDNENFDAELSLNTYYTTPLNSFNDIKEYTLIRPYRVWCRYSTDQFEARLGLQKINFGPAKILRSLMWFDRIDPRDPQGLTDGVYGLLMRYFFLDNSNVWVWGLYGNEEAKGLEASGTYSRNVECGGRYQFPVPMGEVALTYHSRRTADDAYETRSAVDGSWDIGVGLWAEAVLQNTTPASGSKTQDKLLTLGSDYTFDLGTGLHVLGEYMLSDSEQLGVTYHLLAISADYSLTIIDSLKAIVSYYGETENIDYYCGWQGTYDDWTVNLSVYESSSAAAGSLFSDKGVHVLVTWNH
ncbi:MAG: hypothetical protein ABIH39_01685 [Candidatus Margulisiibacteriota bacterium]